MNVQQVVDLAKNSELKNLQVGGDDVILSYLNLGLIELYKRFALSVKEHVVALQDEVEIYDMPDDFMWMITAYGEVPEDDKVSFVNILPINEEDNPISINMVNWHQVQVPLALTGDYVSLIYRASPDYLTEANMNDRIPIPVQMVDPLTTYMGYKAHASLDANVQDENNTYYQRFEIACDRIEKEGMFTSDDLSMVDRLKTRGFA